MPEPVPSASGIGLTNVQQRLDLLYPGKYELIIRPTVDEFFVHLTLQLPLKDEGGKFEPADTSNVYSA